MAPKVRRLEDYGFTSSTVPKRSRAKRDFGNYEELSPLNMQPSSFERLVEDFDFKVRIHSRKKATSNDPKPSLSEVGLPRLITPTTAIDLNDDSSEDSEDEFPIDSEDHKFPFTLGDVEIEPLGVGYLKNELAEYHEFADIPWLEVIDVVVTRTRLSPDGYKYRSRVGFCAAKLIRRHKFRTMFHRQMCKPFDESTLMALDLFDQYGQLKNQYKDHIFLKGSGAWQDQLDEGDLLLIEDATVDEHYRRRGFATAMIEALLAVTHRKTAGGNFATILWPQWNKNDHFQDLLRTVVSPTGGLFRADVIDWCDPAATPWARSLGFRRIGLSMWFGLLCRDGTTFAVTPVEYDHDPHILKEVKNLLPKSLRHAKCDKQFLTSIRQYYHRVRRNDKVWLATDEERNNLLHIACLHFFPKSVAWILRQSCSEKLLKMRNSSRHTPLEATVQMLETTRSRSLIGNTVVLKADKFNGYTFDQARCIALIRKIEIDSEEELEKFRYGCTCDECHAGYLSPRMNYVLFLKASMERNRLEDELELSGATFMDENEWVLLHLPDYTMKYLRHYKAMRRGLINVFGHISDCLLHRLAPNHSMVRLGMIGAQDEQPALVRRLFKNKGNIEGAFGMILEKASWEDEIHGDGWIKEMREDDEENEEPECRNDHDFALVARKCGYSAVADFMSVGDKDLTLPLS